MIVLTRIDATRNMRRYYCLHLEPTLFGEIALVREWGRIGAKSGQSKMATFATEDAATVALARLASIKRRRGYCEQST